MSKPYPREFRDDVVGVARNCGDEVRLGQVAKCGSRRSPNTSTQGKVYLCAVKDLFSGRIGGYSIDSRMKAHLAVAALDNAVARRRLDGQPATGCVPHSDRGSQFRSRKLQHAINHHAMARSMGTAGTAGNNAAMESFIGLLQNTTCSTVYSAAPMTRSGSRF